MLYGVQASAKLFLFWDEANKPQGGRCDVALEANFEGKRSEEGCYGATAQALACRLRQSEKAV